MSEGKKTFRLGGAGGYSVHAVGHAPTRRGCKPAYETVQLRSDLLGGSVMFDVPLTAENVVGACAAVSAAGSLCEEDIAFLCGLLESALQNSAMN